MPLTKNELLEYWINKPTGENVYESDCEAIEYVLDNCEITVPETSNFFVNVSSDGEDGAVNLRVVEKRSIPFKTIAQKEHGAAEKAYAYRGCYDFNHTTCDWDSVFSLGISGLKKRAEEYASKNTDGNKKQFYDGLVKVFSAATRFLKRAAKIAHENGKERMANGLANLAQNPPSNLFEAMQLSFIYYTLMLSVEGTYIRTFGRADRLLMPFLGTVSREEAEKLLDDYMWEIDAKKYDANIPFAICGTDENGNDATNEMSYMLLDAYKRNAVSYVKLHFLCSEKTPEDIVKSALDGVRNGKNSIVFMSDEMIISSLIKQGASEKDARNYHVVGCYECGADNEVTCSCNGFFSIPKALEYTLYGGVDMLSGEQIGLENDGKFASFDELFSEFKRQLKHIAEQDMALIDIYEENYSKLHCAPFMSGTYLSALENGGDIYTHNGARYCNSSVNAIGLATAADSLYAVKRLVYDEKSLTLDELREILKNNWQGSENVRLTVMKKYPKFGMNNAELDGIAKEIMQSIYPVVCGRPNKKGGTYRLGTFSIDHRWYYGKMTGASADGRLCGESISQNASANFGCEKNGVLAHILSVTGAIDGGKTNGTVVDIDFHESSVSGEAGLNAFTSILKGYLKNGGFAVHFNVLNTEILKDARENPQKYPHLIVRVCGWSARFNSLSTEAQEEFIKRSEK